MKHDISDNINAQTTSREAAKIARKRVDKMKKRMKEGKVKLKFGNAHFTFKNKERKNNYLQMMKEQMSEEEFNRKLN